MKKDTSGRFFVQDLLGGCWIHTYFLTVMGIHGKQLFFLLFLPRESLNVSPTWDVMAFEVEDEEGKGVGMTMATGSA
jgi:hypothetical protein